MDKEKNTEKRKALLDSARAEFLRCGYEKTTIHGICDNAGMTTGALYFYFRNKADIFDQLVRDTALAMNEIIDEQVKLIVAQDSEAILAEVKSRIRFLIEHRDELILLTERSGGTKYAGFRFRMISRFAEAYYGILEQGISDEATSVLPVISNVIAQMNAQCFSTILEMKEMSHEEIEVFLEELFRYTMAGIRTLIRQNRNNE